MLRMQFLESIRSDVHFSRRKKKFVDLAAQIPDGMRENANPELTDSFHAKTNFATRGSFILLRFY